MNDTTAPIEAKVSAQAIATLAATALVGLLTWLDAITWYGLANTAAASVKAASVVPVQHLAVLALIPPGIGFYAGYRARHTSRPDLQPVEHVPSPDVVPSVLAPATSAAGSAVLPALSAVPALDEAAAARAAAEVDLAAELDKPGR